MHKRSEAEIKRRIARHMRRETFSPSAHHAHHYLHLVSALGADSAPVPPRLHVSDAEVAAIRARFALSDESPLFALNAAAEYGPAKRWPVARFIEAAARLHSETRCRWVVLGGSGDRALAETVVSELRSRISPGAIVNVAGQTSLRDLCALLKGCALLLTNDTGPMHVAAALGTPVVVPFGSTSPELTGPVAGNCEQHEIVVGEAPCAPCFRRQCPVDFRCMDGIPVEAVVAAVHRVFTRPTRRISV
jgi:heptosyltransferase-2